MTFEWDDAKNLANQLKHGVSFEVAQQAFADPDRFIETDVGHSTPDEIRYYCYGKVHEVILTVRFTIRGQQIRIIGAGEWRKGRSIYENR